MIFKFNKANIKKPTALAPMAGVGDRAFREICVENGAGYTVGELCSAKGVTYDSAKSKQLLMTYPAEQPCAVQLFGDDPLVIAKAVEIALKFSPIAIDLNMGCPAPKIIGNNSGAALMKDLPLAEKIIKAAVDVSCVPVSVKFRSGWDENCINAVELAQRAENAGAMAVSLHGRTKAQMYSPPVDLEIIKSVKSAVGIFVIGNGGIDSPEKAKEMYEYTGCDLVMIGQGALGRPWIFDQINTYLETGVLAPDPTTVEKLAIMRRQIERTVEYKGEVTALKEARTHAIHYMRGLKNAANFRRLSGELSSLSDLDIFIEKVIEHETAGI